MSKLYACQGTKDGKKCMELFDGSCPKVCPVCGSTDIKQGIQNLSFEQKQLFSAMQRTVNNNRVKKLERLTGGKKK